MIDRAGMIEDLKAMYSRAVDAFNTGDWNWQVPKYWWFAKECEIFATQLRNDEYLSRTVKGCLGTGKTR